MKTSAFKIAIILLALTFTKTALSQSVSYSGPQVYTVGTSVPTLMPTVTGFTPVINGQTSTLAGNGTAGHIDANGTSASFNHPGGLTQDAAGNVYVGDGWNNCIRKITPAGVVTTLAGSGTAGYADGTGASAQFNQPYGLVADAAGNLYVADYNNNRIRKVTPGGVVTTIAGSGTAGYADGNGTAASFNHPSGVVIDGAGNLFVADCNNNMIRKISPTGTVTTFAGNITAGSANATGASASFNHPFGLTINLTNGNIYVADWYNFMIRQITPNAQVTTLAGSITSGAIDGTGAAANFYYPSSIISDALGNMYVTDEYNNKIRKVTIAGVVTTVAGTGTQGPSNGVGASSTFYQPLAIVADNTGYVYVAEYGNSLVRKVAISPFTVNLTLPAGLNFNAANGYIAGMPDAASATTNYTVTGYTATGFISSSALSITVSAAPPIAPSLTQNFITSYTTRVPGIVTNNALAAVASDKTQVATDVQYYDGVGRPLQTVQSQASPQGKDMVQPFDYDQFGRESVKYLPYTATTADGSYKTDALTTGAGVMNYYNPAGSSGTQQSNGIVRTTNPYASTGYEPSPLNRVVEQGAPGVTWQMPGTGSANSNGNTTRIVYTTNNTVTLTDTAHSFLVQKYTVTIGANELRTLVLSGTYLPGTLYVTIHRDENWKSGRGGTTEEYKDLEGHVILKRTYNWTPNMLKVFSTYYVYDDFGDLCFVLTPLSGADTALPIQTTLDNLCYQYKYDERNRLSQKHLPGQKAWVSMVYNQLDQPVLSQDANQSAPTQNQWTVTKYNVQGKPIMTGLWNAGSAIPLATLQSSIYGAAQWDTRDQTNLTTGYAVSSYPATLNTTLSISYYDDYTAPNKPSTNVAPSGASVMTHGEPTATLVNILGTTNMLWSINYYDDLGRVVQAYQQHNQGGGVTLSVNNYDVTTSTYNFVNTVNTTVRKHWNASNTTSPLLTINNNYIYDHRERRLKSFEQINGSTNVLIAQSDYNEIGQLLTKHLHSETGSAPFLQDVGYTYNERGWLRTGGAAGNLFYMDLRYDTPDAGISKQYNGNISELLYTGNTSGSKTFSYGYDQLDRLLQATSTGSTLNETISYDLMGNITALTRTGVSPATLAYTYLNSGLSDQVSTITNSGSAFRSYGYDNNGNAGGDGGSKTLAYNVLNLPTTVTQAGTTLATYTYDASGTKIRNTGTDGTWDYVNGVVYNNNTIVFVQTETGRAIPIAGVYHYEHNLTDNLGNVRLTFDKDPNTGLVRALQEDEYYAFGLRSPRQDNSNHNRYLYNGKEIQTDLANQYDYGARFYDPVIGRWWVVDPLSEKDRRWSPYAYVLDNPIRLIDPDGMEAENSGCCDVPNGNCGNCNTPIVIGGQMKVNEGSVIPSSPPGSLTAEQGGEVLSTSGTIVTGLAYVAAVVPGAEEFAPPLFAGGRGLSAAGAATTAADQFSKGKTSDGVVTLTIGVLSLANGQIIDDAAKAGQATKGAALLYNLGVDISSTAADALHNYAMKKTEALKPNVPKIAPKVKDDQKRNKFVQDWFKNRESAKKTPKQKGKTEKKTGSS